MKTKRNNSENLIKKEDKKFMRQALSLSKKGAGWVSPNPMVGAIIVKNGKIIGMGWHKKFGENHAEINAINDTGETKVKDSSLYITLEPCCFYGKTPPCTDAIIKSGIKRVVIGSLDPNPKVNGKGIKMLKKNGIKVNVGVLENEARKSNEFFIKFHKKGLPFIISKWAMSLDGCIATSTGESKWITSEKSRQYVHKLRSQVDAIIVGINTIIKDDPQLNVRLNGGELKQPKKIILDSKLRTPLDAKCLNDKTGGETIIATITKNKSTKTKKLKERGAKIIYIKSKDGKVDLIELLKKLKNDNILSCLVEGGAEVNSSFFKEKLVDKVVIFIAPKIIGGGGIYAPLKGFKINISGKIINLTNPQIKIFGKDICVEGYIEAFS